MNRDAFDSLDREGVVGVALAQAEAIERLSAKVVALEAKIAQLEAKPDRPPKTPNNSSGSRRGGGWNWVGVVSGLLNPNDSGVGALERRPRHDQGYHEGGGWIR